MQQIFRTLARPMAWRAAFVGGPLLTWSVGYAQEAPAATEPQLTPQQIEEIMREPPSHVAEMPPLRLDSARYEPTAVERAEIAKLIEQLAEIDKPDFGMAPWMSGSQFAPVKSSQQFGAGIIMVDHGLKTSDAVLRLVELGPKALPMLLDALDDGTPTKVTMEFAGGMGGMWYGREIGMNPANPREQKVKEAHPTLSKPEGGFAGGFDKNIDEHKVTRGDVCFVIIGQIVNRGYQAVRYQPTACRVVNSPTHDPEIAKVVREVWMAEDPAEMLFKSLMTDLHTRGGAAEYQISAATRLLYYFPAESRDVIVKRLDAFDVRDIPANADWQAEWRERQEVNGDTRPDDFIKAVAFSDDPAIAAAILSIIERTNDPQIFCQCLSESVANANPDLVLKKMADIIAVAPPPDQGPFGGEYHTLRAAAILFPDKSRPMFDAYLKHDTLECTRAAIHALNRAKGADKPDKPVPWAVEFLSQFLDNKTDTGWQYGPDYDRRPIRVCDEAAQMLTTHVTGATFELKGEAADLDRQIESIRRRIAGQPVEGAVAKAAMDFAAVAKREPLAAFDLADDLGQIYSFSDEKTLYASYGYRANGWACDTMSIDVASGAAAGRVKFDEWNGGVSILRPIVGETAVCFHNGAGGDMVTRDLRTGRELNRIATPFHEGLGENDPLIVRGLGDIFLTGDGKTAMAFTRDGALHAINLQSGVRSIVWKHPGEPSWKEVGFQGSLVPVQGTNRMMLEFFGEDDEPLRIWDQDLQQMTEIRKVPNGAWRSAWGKYACNHLNSNIVFWDLEARKPLDLPLPEGSVVSDLLCDSDQSTLLVSMADGTVWLIDIQSLKPLAKLQTPQTSGRVSLALSGDDRLLFWSADETQYDRETGERSNPKTKIAIFSIEEGVE